MLCMNNVFFILLLIGCLHNFEGPCAGGSAYLCIFTILHTVVIVSVSCLELHGFKSEKVKGGLFTKQSIGPIFRVLSRCVLVVLVFASIRVVL